MTEITPTPDKETIGKLLAIDEKVNGALSEALWNLQQGKQAKKSSDVRKAIALLNQVIQKYPETEILLFDAFEPNPEPESLFYMMVYDDDPRINKKNLTRESRKARALDTILKETGEDRNFAILPIGKWRDESYGFGIPVPPMLGQRRPVARQLEEEFENM